MIDRFRLYAYSVRSLKDGDLDWRAIHLALPQLLEVEKRSERAYVCCDGVGTLGLLQG